MIKLGSVFRRFEGQSLWLRKGIYVLFSRRLAFVFLVRLHRCSAASSRSRAPPNTRILGGG